METIPDPVFDRLLTAPPLTEAPRILNRRPGRGRVIKAFNSGLQRLLDRGTTLLPGLEEGELDVINAKIGAGEELAPDEKLFMRDRGTILDAMDVSYGLRNINFTNDPTSRKDINYLTGNFHLIEADGDWIFDEDTIIDRHSIPVEYEGKSFAIPDGAPVEGIIRNIDREIAELKAREDVTRLSKLWQLRTLRKKRDVLFTSSTPIYKEDDDIRHARAQYEAKLRDGDVGLPEIDLILADRRVLDIPRGSERWLPLLYPALIIGFLAYSLGLCHERTKPIPISFGLVNVCEDVTGAVFGATFNTEILKWPKDGEKPTFEEVTQKEMVHAIKEWDQQEQPGFEEAYLNLARADSYKTASRILGYGGSIDPQEPFIKIPDSENNYLLRVSCIPPQQRLQQAKVVIKREGSAFLLNE